MKAIRTIFAVLLLSSQIALAQAKPEVRPANGAPIEVAPEVAPEVVPIDKEPSHHLVFENEYVRVFSVEVAPHSETKYHQHDRDYVGVILGDAEVESVRLGEAAVKLSLKDGETRFTQGGFAHKAVNKSDKPFRNVTVELKKGAGELDKRSTGLMTGMGQGFSTNVIIARNVACYRTQTSNPPPGIKRLPVGGAHLLAGKRYLVIAASPSYKSSAFRDREGAVEIVLGATLWVETIKEEAVVTYEARAGLAYCRFEANVTGSSPQPNLFPARTESNADSTLFSKR